MSARNIDHMRLRRRGVILDPVSLDGLLDVLGALDAADAAEAALVGYSVQADPRPLALDLLAGADRGGTVLVAVDGPTGARFAVLGLSPAFVDGGVATCGLLARDHRRWRREIARLCGALRHALPEFAAARGLRRLEARSWAAHPTGRTLLAALGFGREAILPGYGAGGEAFELWSFITDWHEET